jgi:diguanylate cyclase (GGDEF)-like protein/PAS domain S-box-containing protein
MTEKTNLRLIIIDDNPEIHKDFIKILTAKKSMDALDALHEQLFGKEETLEMVLPEFQIDTVSQGQEGLDHIKRAIYEGNPYALAFVDIRMPPGWDGIETIKRIWAVDPDMQIVICTAYSDYTWEETVDELGLSDNLLILKKPFDNVAVRQLACALTKKWELLRESKEQKGMLEERIKERTDSLQTSLSLIRSTLESSADGILVVDNQDQVVDYNTKFLELWEIPSNMLASKDAHIIYNYIFENLVQPQEFMEKNETLKSKPDSVTIEIIKLKNGKIFEQYSQPHKLHDKTIGRVWSFRDITQRASLEEKLEFQATHDSLTGLPNRVLLMDRLMQACANAKRNGSLLALLYFDLDRFKLINDSLSHEAGDMVLKTVSRRVLSVIREQDTLSRLGGDEFVLILPDLNKEESAVIIANKLLSIIRENQTIENRQIVTTASIGIAIYPRDGEKVDELLRHADLAMYRSKDGGGNQAQFYTTELSSRGIQLLENEAELRRALEKQEFFLLYQPQFNVRTGELIAVEALIRWHHPTKGILLPIDFIPFAEATGLIIPMGEWVLRTACRQNKEWQSKGYPPIKVAVNMSAQQFKQRPSIDVTIDTILKETGLEGQYLEIELTESMIVNNLETINILKKIKELGVHIALDDFGSGSTTLNYLRMIPVDHVKIDRSFIQNIQENRNNDAMIKAIISMANSLNLDVLAEGVESAQQLEFLKENNCKEAQGFYFRKPMKTEDLEEYLKTEATTKTVTLPTLKSAGQGS